MIRLIRLASDPVQARLARRGEKRAGTGEQIAHDAAGRHEPHDLARYVERLLGHVLLRQRQAAREHARQISAARDGLRRQLRLPGRIVLRGTMTAVQSERPRTGRPALKLVKTRDLSRDDWLSVRRTGIGGSDAAAAVGLSPYVSRLALWIDKTGRSEGMPSPAPDDTTSPTYWGTLLEPIVAAVYTRVTGNRVRKINAVLRHPTIPWMLANIDREIVGASDVQILECKTAGEHGARLWRDGVPEYIELQVQHQLAVTGKAGVRNGRVEQARQPHRRNVARSIEGAVWRSPNDQRRSVAGRCTRNRKELEAHLAR